MTYEAFDYSVTGSGSVRITRGGRLITIVGGAGGRTLIAKLGVSDARDQTLLQRATGNYKRGNERRP